MVASKWKRYEATTAAAAVCEGFWVNSAT